MQSEMGSLDPVRLLELELRPREVKRVYIKIIDILTFFKNKIFLEQSKQASLLALLCKYNLVLVTKYMLCFRKKA